MAKLAEIAESLNEMSASLADRMNADTGVPSYSRKGVEELAEYATRCASDAMVASGQHAEALKFFGLAKALFTQDQFTYQNGFDAVVEGVARLGQQMSWEERAAICRTRVVDAAIILHGQQILFVQIEETVKAIAVQARAFADRRWAVGQIIQTLQVGQRMSELE